jgi:hypothetical protein
VLGLAAQALAHLDASWRGHHDVEADEVRTVRGDGAQGRLTVRGLDDVVPLAQQELAEQRERRRLVVHREDQRPLPAHRSRPCTVSANVAKSIGLLK